MFENVRVMVMFDLLIVHASSKKNHKNSNVYIFKKTKGRGKCFFYERYLRMIDLIVTNKIKQFCLYL